MTNPNALPEEFFVAVAVGIQPYADVCAVYGVPEEDRAALQLDPAFKRRLLTAEAAVEDSGEAFSARCRFLANDAVSSIIDLIKNPESPASVQLEAFRSLVKFGRLEPKVEALNTATGPQLVLTIVAPNGTTNTTVALPSTPIPALAAPPDDPDDDLPTQRLSTRDLGFWQPVP